MRSLEDNDWERMEQKGYLGWEQEMQSNEIGETGGGVGVVMMDCPVKSESMLRHSAFPSRSLAPSGDLREAARGGSARGGSASHAPMPRAIMSPSLRISWRRIFRRGK